MEGRPEGGHWNRVTESLAQTNNKQQTKQTENSLSKADMGNQYETTRVGISHLMCPQMGLVRLSPTGQEVGVVWGVVNKLPTERKAGCSSCQE